MAWRVPPTISRISKWRRPGIEGVWSAFWSPDRAVAARGAQLTKRAGLSETLRDARRPHSGTSGLVGNSPRNPGESPVPRSIGHFRQVPGWQGVNREEWEFVGRGLAPQVGLEPTTLRLTAECSTIELLRSNELTSLEQTDCRVSNTTRISCRFSCKMSPGDTGCGAGIGARGVAKGIEANVFQPLSELAQQLQHPPVELVAAPVFVSDIAAVAVQNPERTAKAPQRPAPVDAFPERQEVSHPA